jgi:hypothetical protein
VAGGGNAGGQGSVGQFVGYSGFANTGGGGGGGFYDATGSGSYSGGAGGSGIVIIRYPAYLAPATAVGANTYISGPYRVYVWVSSGSITF